MTPYRLFVNLAMALLLMLSLISCGPSKEELKNEADSSRKVGEAYLRAGNSTAALKEFIKAEKIYPDSYILQNDLGLVYLGKGRIDLAIKHFKRSIELKADYAPGKNNLGYAYLQNKQYDEAIEIFTDASKDMLDANPHRPLSGLGAAYYFKGQYQQSERYYLKALEINPRHPPALWGLGRTQMASGDLAKAIESLEKAVELAPNFTQAWFDLGKAYGKNQQADSAILAFEKVQALAPDSQMAVSAAREIKALGK